MHRDRDIFYQSPRGLQYTVGHHKSKEVVAVVKFPMPLHSLDTRNRSSTLIGGFSSAPWARTKSCAVGTNHERMIYREVKPLFASKLGESEQLQHLTLRKDNYHWAPYHRPNQLFANPPVCRSCGNILPELDAAVTSPAWLNAGAASLHLRPSPF
jgi:hypothetical protein